MDCLVHPAFSSPPIADISIKWNGWADAGGMGAVAHVTTANGIYEEIELGHIGQWEHRLGRLIRIRWPGRLDCRWIAPHLHLRVWQSEEAY